MILLDEKVALFTSNWPITPDEAASIRQQFRDELPDWKVVVIDGPSEITDLRTEANILKAGLEAAWYNGQISEEVYDAILEPIEKRARLERSSATSTAGLAPDATTVPRP